MRLITTRLITMAAGAVLLALATTGATAGEVKLAPAEEFSPDRVTPGPAANAAGHRGTNQPIAVPADMEAAVREAEQLRLEQEAQTRGPDSDFAVLSGN